jgi:uncharacterized protein (DUF1330 family)
MLQPAAHGKLEKAHGHALRTLNGRVVSIEGPPPPKNVAIVEWDSLDDAVAFLQVESLDRLGAAARKGAEDNPAVRRNWRHLSQFHLTGSDRYPRFQSEQFCSVTVDREVKNPIRQAASLFDPR